MKKYRGIDTSLFQGEIDANKLTLAGVDFVMHKAGQGRTTDYPLPFTDPFFEENVKSCALSATVGKRRLYSGSYWYMMAQNEEEVRREAAYYIELLKKYRYNLQLWAAVDVEDPSLPQDKELLTSLVKLFCELIREAGFRPMVYASSSWLDYRFDAPKDVPIWEANWSAGKMPGRARMWQYTNTGIINGVNGYVDMNVAYGIIGDANFDGKVTISDAVAITKRIAGYDVKLDDSQADVNQDGRVTVADAAAIVKAIAGH